MTMHWSFTRTGLFDEINWGKHRPRWASQSVIGSKKGLLCKSGKENQRISKVTRTNSTDTTAVIVLTSWLITWMTASCMRCAVHFNPRATSSYRTPRRLSGIHSNEMPQFKQEFNRKDMGVGNFMVLPLSPIKLIYVIDGYKQSSWTWSI